MKPPLDQFGRPVRKRELTEEIAGATVWRRSPFRTWTPTGLTPAQLGSVLRQAEQGDPVKYLELAEDIEEKYHHYLAVLGTRRRAVSQLTVSMDPVEESAEAEADAELVREWTERSELSDELHDLLDAVGKGYAVSEIIWETSERQWMPKALTWRDPRWFRFDPVAGTALEFQPEGGSGWEPLTPYKFVPHVVKSKSGLPVRGGLARPALWAWLLQSFGLRDWSRSLEAYGHPIRLGKFGSGASKEDKAILLRAVKNVADDLAAIIPDSMSLEFGGMEGAAARLDLYRDFIQYLDERISLVVIGQTLTSEKGESGGGSRALGEVHERVREDVRDNDARQLAQTLRHCVAGPIAALNRGPGRKPPIIRIGAERTIPIEQLASALGSVARGSAASRPTGIWPGGSGSRDTGSWPS